MTPLERALRERIQSEGPISVEAYMEACNAYYYATRDPLGAHGDFTTAPEISQMFGEMIGAALADCWRGAGSPADAVYAELGPGRGTLACDALRLLRSAGFSGAVHLVETSPVLRDAQRVAVPGAIWHDSIEDLPAAPLLLVANEFLDALPVRQHVAGVERRVMIAGGGLAFDRDGEVVETSPSRDEAVNAIAACLAVKGGVALIIDYGHGRSRPDDTLQAVRGHGFAPVLAEPGEQDLTAHVDFQAVAAVARRAGAEPTPLVTQGEWLIRLGIEARAQALSRANPERAEDVLLALERLVARDQMGGLFKVMALHASDWPVPGGLRMTITYRDATPADGPALKELFAESFVETFGHLYRPSDLREFLDTNSPEKWGKNLADPEVAIRIAEVDGEILGFIELAPQQLPYEAAGPSIELRRLYLRSKAHGQGIADELMEWILKEAARRGARELVLSVYVDNHRARRFYERYGFEVVGRYDFMVGTHADEDLILRHVIMQAHA